MKYQLTSEFMDELKISDEFLHKYILDLLHELVDKKREVALFKNNLQRTQASLAGALSGQSFAKEELDKYLSNSSHVEVAGPEALLKRGTEKRVIVEWK